MPFSLTVSIWAGKELVRGESVTREMSGKGKEEAAPTVSRKGKKGDGSNIGRKPKQATFSPLEYPKYI